MASNKPEIITVKDANEAMKSNRMFSLIKISPTLLNNTQPVYEPIHEAWCLTSPLPCTPYYENGTTFYMRGNTLFEGFAPTNN